jgi:glycosyltransferase involved in cell wall biosynthesis
LLLPMSEGALRECPPRTLPPGRPLVLPIPVEPSGAIEAPRDIAAVTYAAHPAKKGTARVLDAWRRARGPGDELVVAGCAREDLVRAGIDLGSASDGIHVAGLLSRADYRALLRRARVFVCAPRREDYGIAQLEALADGCQLVSSPASGPYPAFALAAELDARLVGEDLVAALRVALTEPSAGYQTRAQRALAPFSRAVADRLVERELLPRLLARPRACAAS